MQIKLVFVSFIDRNVRMKNAKVHLKDHLQQKEKLDKQERILRSKYDKVNGPLCKVLTDFCCYLNTGSLRGVFTTYFVCLFSLTQTLKN